jgi:uncharacterized membrane protein YqjE
MDEPLRRQGLMVSLRRLLATLLELAHVRLQLVLNELDQQKLRLFDALLIAAASLVALALGLVLLVAFYVGAAAAAAAPAAAARGLLVGAPVLGLADVAPCTAGPNMARRTQPMLSALPAGAGSHSLGNRSRYSRVASSRSEISVS